MSKTEPIKSILEIPRTNRPEKYLVCVLHGTTITTVKTFDTEASAFREAADWIQLRDSVKVFVAKALSSFESKQTKTIDSYVYCK